MKRKYIVGGNWKCNGTVDSCKKLVQMLNEYKDMPAADKAEIVVSPTALHLLDVKASLRKDIEVAAQNCALQGNGAFTGEISADMLKDAGLKWTILGHSERRKLYGESNDVVGKKVDYALKTGLLVIACIGETLEERERGDTMKVIQAQMEPIVAAVKDQWPKVVLAYEPVWAIGTGKVATPEQAQEVHKSLRGWLATKVSAAVANAVRIMYGGSVTGDNSKSLIALEDVDGFLVGGASLKPDFLKIIESVK